MNHPDFAGVIDIESGEEFIFGNDIDIEDIVWMGNQPSVTELAQTCGVQKTMPFNALNGFLHDAKSKGRKIHFLPPYRYRNAQLLSDVLDIHHSQLKENSSLELVKAIIDLRSIKEEREILAIKEACVIGYDMHTTAMKMCKPGIVEQRIAGALEGIACASGAMPSFPIILTQNGQTLHNNEHHHVLEEGRLMLTDAGAENNMNYCSDFTRTVPVGGKFSSRQKDIYNLVLKCNNYATSIARPGLTYQYIHLEVCKILVAGLKDLGLMKGDVDSAVAAGAHALFLPHGLGHMMGLDVHDMEDLGQIYVGYDDITRPIDQFGTAYLRLGRELQKGFVITNEPGCYFIPQLIDNWRSEKLHEEFLNYDVIETYKQFGGIRLEDDLLITENGAEILGDKRIPITVDEIENLVGSF